MSARAERFPLFDSLRAIAALSIVAFHASFAPGALDALSGLAPYARRLDVGVSIFFLVSGFLLYRPFVVAHLDGTERPAAGPYAWRRFLRIAPGYWVALTAVAIWLGLSGVFTPSGVASYYGFAQGYRAETFAGGLVQAWTLGVEVAFYALLPLFAIAVRRLLRSRPHMRLRGELAAIAALAAAGLAWNWAALGALDGFGDGAAPWLFSLPAFLHQFAAGMALAVASVALRDRDRAPAAVRLVERFPGLSWLAALLVFVLLATGIGLDTGAVTDGEWLMRSVLSAVLGVFLLLPAVFGDGRRGAVRRLMGSRPLLYLGVGSYGIYLYHVAVIQQLERWGFAGAGGDVTGFLAWVLVATAGAAALATLSWRLVERPALRLKGRVGRRREREPVAAGRASPASATALASGPADGR